MVAVVAAAFLVVTPARIQSTTMAVGTTHGKGSGYSSGKVLHVGLSRCCNLRRLPYTKHMPASYAELTTRWGSGCMHMGTDQFVLQLMKLVLAGDFRRGPYRYQW